MVKYINTCYCSNGGHGVSATDFNSVFSDYLTATISENYLIITPKNDTTYGIKLYKNNMGVYTYYNIILFFNTSEYDFQLSSIDSGSGKIKLYTTDSGFILEFHRGMSSSNISEVLFNTTEKTIGTYAAINGINHIGITVNSSSNPNLIYAVGKNGQFHSKTFSTYALSPVNTTNLKLTPTLEEFDLDGTSTGIYYNAAGPSYKSGITTEDDNYFINLIGALPD